MARNRIRRAGKFTLHLNRPELMALYGFLALGAHFAAATSGEGSPLSPNEIDSHVAAIGTSASKTLLGKIAKALLSGRQPEKQ